MKTQEEVYKELYDKKYAEILYDDYYATYSSDGLSRIANKYAVKNTVQVWKEQYE